MKRLMIIVPCYNEQEVFPVCCEQLTTVLTGLIRKEKISPDSKILFVNDGSTDTTWDCICRAHAANPFCTGLDLAANVGQQNALLAGIITAKDICDMAVTIDADLQDDITAIEKMVDACADGADVVYGVRSDRENDTFFKCTSAQGFYRVMRGLGVRTVYNHADFRLMSAAAMQQLAAYSETNLFLRGLVPDMGFPSACVPYTRQKRAAGKSKYPLRRMLSFAWQGITSFSIKPIQLIAALGGIIIGCSVIAFIYTLIAHFTGKTVAGWSSLMISIWFLGGVQLFSIGIIGQYVGKTYIETKHRPRYRIREFLGQEADTDAD